MQGRQCSTCMSRIGIDKLNCTQHTLVCVCVLTFQGPSALVLKSDWWKNTSVMDCYITKNMLYTDYSKIVIDGLRIVVI